MTVSKHHCKVTITDTGEYVVENMSPNGTQVDGVSVVRTTAHHDSVIQLGPTFSAKLHDLIGKPEVKSQDKTFGIKHLSRVWENYNEANIEAAERQRKLNLTRAGLGIFTLCAMPTCFFLGPVGYVLTAIGVAGNVYSYVGMKNAETTLERQERQDAFDDAWVCPNPECGKTLPARNYRLLVKNYKSCPYCKCKYEEK